jgi:type 1 fimbria pilin
MAKGTFTGTSASAMLVDADTYRNQLVIQKTNATTVALGIGEAAVAGSGIQLTNADSVAIIRGAQARKAIYVIGNGGTGTYQDGDVEVYPGPLAT